MKLDLTRASRIRGPEGEVGLIRLPGGGRWEKPASGPVGVAAIPGHLWSNSEPIGFADTGAHVPAIPLLRDAGPVVVYARFTRTSANGTILGLRTQNDGWFNMPLMIMAQSDGWTLRLNAGGGYNDLNGYPTPVTQSVIARANSTTRWFEVLGDFGWGAATDATPAATTELRIGHSIDMNTGLPWFRAAGTLHRAAIFARSSLTPAEESEVLAWLAQ